MFPLSRNSAKCRLSMSRVPFLPLLLCAALNQVGCTGPVREPDARVFESTAAVDRIFARWNSDDSAGCAVGVVRDERMVLQRSYGMASIEHGVPITGKTVFDIGSNSKQFTAMAVLMLANDGRLSIDDDVRKFIPELPVYPWPVTLRHLLHHTSGLRDYVDLLDFAGNHEQDLVTEAEVLTMLTRQKDPQLPTRNDILLQQLRLSASRPDREARQRDVAG